MGCGCRGRKAGLVKGLRRAGCRKLARAVTKIPAPRKKWTPEAEREFERKHGRPRRTVIRGGANNGSVEA